MATPRRRIVRQQPLHHSILAYLNPLDNLLALTSTFEAWDTESAIEQYAVPFGIIMNALCFIARLNANTEIGLFGSKRAPDILLRPGQRMEDLQMGGGGGFGFFVCPMYSKSMIKER